jgi:hypothetical protein
MKKTILLLLAIFFIISVNAQKSEVGIGIGISTYFGDLNSPSMSTNISQSHPAFQVFYNYYFNQYLNTRLSLGQGTISGDDNKSSSENHKERNLSFKSNITEFSGIVEFNIFGVSSRFSPFLFGGLNVFHFNPKTEYDGEWIYLQPLGTEGQGSELHPEKLKYKLIDLSLIFGGGLKFKLNNSIVISLELGWRKTQSDYLDDVSGEYINFSELKRTNGDLAAYLSDRTNEYFSDGTNVDRRKGDLRGSANMKDYYSMTFVNFLYKLNSGAPFKNNRRIYCPKF